MLWTGLLIGFAAVAASASAIGPIFHTTSGPIECADDDSGKVQVCHGVPFAAPPVGDLRWKPTQPPANWTALKETKRKRPGCPQLDFVRFEHIGDEDCLWLSVYTPKQCTPESPCPVMHWIYGGAWVLGSNEEFGIYDGTNLAAQYGVVLVAANYRLDTLGWMALDEFEAESPTNSYGNYGLMDQGFALEWTQANARAFGGDPSKVAIFGESAGGYSVCQHLTRPASNGLFSAAIMESGGCDGPWTLFDGENSKAWGDYYSTKVGCPRTPANPADRLTCLREKKVSELLEPYTEWFCPVDRPKDPWCNRSVSVSSHSPKSQNPSHRPKFPEFPAMPPERVAAGATWPSPRPPIAPLVGWAATVDGTAEGLPETPYHAMLKGKINRSPSGDPINVVFGTNKDEMALFIIGYDLAFKGVKLPVSEQDISAAAKHLVAYHQPSWNASVSDAIVAAYSGGAFAASQPAYRAIAMGTDTAFLCNTRQAAAALAAHGVNAYVYLFDFKSAFYIDPNSELCQADSEVGCGISHGSELLYVWQHAKLGKGAVVAGLMGRWWTNMAAHGNPNGNSNSTGVEWPKYSAAAPNVMHINEHAAASTVPTPHSVCSLWDSLPNPPIPMS